MFCNCLTTIATEESLSSMENMDSPWLEIFEGFAVGKKQFTNCKYKTDNLWINNKICHAVFRKHHFLEALLPLFLKTLPPVLPQRS